MDRLWTERQIDNRQKDEQKIENDGKTEDGQKMDIKMDR